MQQLENIYDLVYQVPAQLIIKIFFILRSVPFVVVITLPFCVQKKKFVLLYSPPPSLTKVVVDVLLLELSEIRNQFLRCIKCSVSHIKVVFPRRTICHYSATIYCVNLLKQTLISFYKNKATHANYTNLSNTKNKYWCLEYLIILYIYL